MKIVLAYSGGLDTSVIVKWLRETYDAEIVTFAADIGQEEELKGLPQKARATGASKHYTLDLVEEFARADNWPGLLPGAVDALVDAYAAQAPQRCSIVGWSLGGMLALRLIKGKQDQPISPFSQVRKDRSGARSARSLGQTR